MALRLDLRRLFRKLGKDLQAKTAAAIASPGGPPNKDGSPKGGSLAAEFRKPKYVKVRRWGYVLQIAALGQKLTWLVRGTRRQPPRPIDFPEPDEDATAKAVENELGKQFEREWVSQRGTRRA